MNKANKYDKIKLNNQHKQTKINGGANMSMWEIIPN